MGDTPSHRLSVTVSPGGAQLIDNLRDVERVFLEALSRDEADRAKFLDESCAHDIDFRRRVEAMLDADARHQGLTDTHLESSPTLTSLVGKSIAGYRLTTVVGNGGMGTVYEAEQENPKRRVALKVLRSWAATPTVLRRFNYEAHILGRLRHPGIAQIYAAGVFKENGVELPYFAMELVHGARSLLEYASEQELGLRERLALFRNVCQAVQHGHQRGIVHRDLKPANILVDDTGQPKVIDFGVARSIDSDVAVTTVQTRVGQLIGTLQYMSPEQCDADPDEIDLRSDVYSLGVVLYELLSGVPPYDASSASLLQATRTIREASPPRLSSIDARLRGDIETIVQKALHKARDERYQSAGELAEDLEHYLNDEPIRARPPTFGYTVSHLLRRHRVATVSTLAVTLGTFALSIGIWIWSFEQGRSAQRLESQLEQQELIAYQKARAASRAFRATAAAAIAQNDPGTARAFLEKVPEDERGWEFDLISRQLDQSEFTLTDQDALAVDGEPLGHVPLIQVAFTGPGTALVGAKTQTNARARAVQVIRDKGEFRIVHVVDLDATERDDVSRWSGFGLTALPESSGYRALFIGWSNERGEHVNIVDLSPNLGVVARREFQLQFPHSVRDRRPYENGALSSSGRFGAFGTGAGCVALIDFDSEEIRYLEGHTDAVTSVSFSDDETQILSASQDLSARVWDVDSGDTRAVLRDHSYYLSSARFQPHGDLIATSSRDGTIRLWSRSLSEKAYQEGSDQGVLLATLTDHDDGVADIFFRGDGKRLVSGSADQTVGLWQVESDAPLFQFRDPQLRSWRTNRFRHFGSHRGHEGRVRNVWFEPTGEYVTSYDLDGVLKFWSPRALPVPVNLEAHGSSVTALAADPTKPVLASGSGDKSVIIWDVHTGRPLSRIFPSASSMVTDLAYHPQESILAISIDTGALSLYDLHDPLRPASVPLDAGTATGRRAIAFSSDGTTLVAGRDDGSIDVYTRGDGSWTQTGRHPIFAEPVGAIAALDGRRVAVGRCAVRSTMPATELDALVVLDLDAGAELARLQMSPDIRDLCYSPTDRRLYAATTNNAPGETRASGDVVVWKFERAHLHELGRLTGHSSGVYTVAVRPGGPIVTGSMDRTAIVWDEETLEPLHVLREHSGSVKAVVFMPHDGTLATASAGNQGLDNVAKLWSVSASSQERRQIAQAQEDWLRVRTAVFQLRQRFSPSVAVVREALAHLPPEDDRTAVQVLRVHCNLDRVREIVEVVHADPTATQSLRQRAATWGEIANEYAGREIVDLRLLRALRVP